MHRCVCHGYFLADMIANIRRIYFYREHPVDGKVNGFPNGQQVDERPDGGGDKTDDDDEQKPIGTR